MRLYIPGWLIPPTLMLALYPDGQLPSRRWRWPVAVAAAAIVVLTASIPVPVVRLEDVNYWVAVPAFPERLADVLVPFKPMYDANTFVTPSLGPTTPVAPEWWPEWTTISAWVFKPLLALTMLVIWVGTVRRLVRARPPRRQQLAWLLCAVMPFLVASLFSNGALVGPLLLLLVPIAVAVGVLRYRLLGIEAVLRRGLVYGTITAAVVGTYLIVTVGAGTALDRPRLPGVIVAALVAVALAPARDRLQRAADQLLFRYGLTAAMAASEEVEIVGEAADGRELLAVTDHTAPDVVLTDLGMPGLDGAAATTAILARHPKVAVLVLTMHEDNEALFGALRAGARGYSTSIETWRAKFGGHPVSSATYTDCVQKLLSKKVDAVTTDGAVLLGYAAQQPDQLEVVGPPFSEESYGIGYRKPDLDFCQFLTDTIKKAQENGNWDKAFDDTLGKAGVETPRKPPVEQCQDQNRSVETSGLTPAS